MKPTLSNLITALNIFMKYGEKSYPTHCERHVLQVCVPPDMITLEDKETLQGLGFSANQEYNCFESIRYGSC